MSTFEGILANFGGKPHHFLVITSVFCRQFWLFSPLLVFE
jgi:hypothetical protein